MKRMLLLCAAGLLLMCFARAETPRIPEGDFAVLDVKLTADRSWPVYTGPGEEYRIANAGKARVGTNGWVQVLGGADGAYLLVQYAVNGQRLRIGWISAEALPKNMLSVETAYALGQAFCWRESHLNRDAALTDDPLLSREAATLLPDGARVQYLARMGEWAYVEAWADGAPACGFVPLDAVTLDPVNVDSHPAFRDAADLLERAGIGFEPAGIRERWKTIYFNLDNGGRFWAYYYGNGTEAYDPALSPLEFNCRFENACDEDIGKYLTEALSMIARAEDGDVDGARNWYDVDQARATIVSNALLYQEYLGEQALRVLLDQLAAHDGQDHVNSLRARLASRILGVRDKTAVDPARGCAWFDALRLARQNDLPPADPALYTDDPLLLIATQLLTDAEAETYAGYAFSPETDVKKCVPIVSLNEYGRITEGNRVSLIVSMGCELIAVYDGTEVNMVSGRWCPLRVTLEQGENGQWRMTEKLEPGDGTEYWPGILNICGGDEAAAEALAQLDSGIRRAVCRYLTANGFAEAARKAGYTE